MGFILQLKTESLAEFKGLVAHFKRACYKNQAVYMKFTGQDMTLFSDQFVDAMTPSLAIYFYERTQPFSHRSQS